MISATAWAELLRRSFWLSSLMEVFGQVVYGDDGQLYLLYADNQVTGLSDDRPGTSVMIDRREIGRAHV